MALTSTSTVKEVIDEYKNTADYDSLVAPDTAKAHRHLVAIRYLLHDLPQVVAQSDISVSRPGLQQEIDDVKAFLGASVPSDNPGVIHLSCEEYLT